MLPAYLAGALMNIPLFIAVIFLPTYIRNLGATNFQVGLLSTVYFLVTILSSLFWGAMSDLLENRKLFSLGSIFCFSLIFFLIAKSTSPTQVILLRACIGLIFPAFSTPLLAFISEHSTTEKRGGDISWYNAFRAIGRTVGLLLTGYLTLFFLLSSIFQFFAFFLLVTVLPIMLLPEKLFQLRIPHLDQILHEMKSRILPTKKGSSLLRENGLIYLYASITLRVICIVGFASFLPLYLTEELGYSLQFLGWFSAVGSGIMIFSMLIAGHSADVVGRKRIILIGLFLSSITPLFYHLGRFLPLLLWLGRITHSFGYSFLMSGSSAFVGDIARKREQGALMGWIRMAFSIGGVIGPLLVGSLLGGIITYAGAAFLMSLFAFSGLILTLVKVKETTHPQDRKTFPKLRKSIREYF